MAATASDVDVDIMKLTGEFDLQCTVAYNLINLGRFVLNKFENTFNRQYNFVGMYMRFTICDVMFYV